MEARVAFRVLLSVNPLRALTIGIWHPEPKQTLILPTLTQPHSRQAPRLMPGVWSELRLGADILW